MRTTFSTPVTPTRERPTGTPGGRSWTSSPAPLAGAGEGLICVTCTVASLARRARRVRATGPRDSPDRRFWYHSALSSAGLAPGTGGEEAREQHETQPNCRCTNATHRRLSVGPGRSERLAPMGVVWVRGRVQVPEKQVGTSVAVETAVVEIEELQAIIGEGQERGFLTAEALAAAVEETELSAKQAQDLLSYLEEHGIEVVAAGEAAELQAPDGRPGSAGPHAEDPSEAHAHDPALASHGDQDEEGAEQIRGLQVRLEDLKRPELDLTVEP